MRLVNLIKEEIANYSLQKYQHAERLKQEGSTQTPEYYREVGKYIASSDLLRIITARELEQLNRGR